MPQHMKLTIKNVSPWLPDWMWVSKLNLGDPFWINRDSLTRPTPFPHSSQSTIGLFLTQLKEYLQKRKNNTHKSNRQPPSSFIFGKSFRLVVWKFHHLEVPNYENYCVEGEKEGLTWRLGRLYLFWANLNVVG